MKTGTQLARMVLAASCLAFCAASNTLAADIVIVANPSVRANSISKEELRDVFLLRTRMLKDGSVVQPVLLTSGPAHEIFLREYLDRRSTEMNIYFQGLVFTGKASMPKQLHSDAEMIAYVRQTKGAIGYISGTAVPDGVKALSIAGYSPESRNLLTRVEPEYPETLRQLGITGNVRLQLVISPKGNVEVVTVLGGNPIFAEAAAKAAKKWIFAPWPSKTTQQVNIPFEIAY